jgi:hypothetical protein
MNDDKLTQVSKLLALAERSSGPEAELAMERAQRIASDYAIDLSVARYRLGQSEKREIPIQKRIHFEDELATKNTRKSLVNLMLAMAGPNDVQMNIFGNSRGIICFGMPSDIQMLDHGRDWVDLDARRLRW